MRPHALLVIGLLGSACGDDAAQSTSESAQASDDAGARVATSGDAAVVPGRDDAQSTHGDPAIDAEVAASPSADSDAHIVGAATADAGESDDAKNAPLDAGARAPSDAAAADARVGAKLDARAVFPLVPSGPPIARPRPPATPVPPVLTLTPVTPVTPPPPGPGGGDPGTDAPAGEATPPAADAPPASPPDMDAGSNAALDAAQLDAALDSPALPDGALASDAGSAASTDGGALIRAAVLDKLRACGVLVGPGAHYVRPIEDAFDLCSANCTLDATCTQVVANECRVLGDPKVRGCINECTRLPQSDGLHCGNISLRHASLCDLIPVCADGSDEASCGVFTCANGQLVNSSSIVCDGLEDCTDGSDEADCASYCPNATR